MSSVSNKRPTCILLFFSIILLILLSWYFVWPISLRVFDQFPEFSQEWLDCIWSLYHIDIFALFVHATPEDIHLKFKDLNLFQIAYFFHCPEVQTSEACLNQKIKDEMIAKIWHVLDSYLFPRNVLLKHVPVKQLLFFNVICN